jgi:tryptophan-rich sensory protein
LFFFNLQAYGFALAWLVLLCILVLLLILNNRKLDRAAAYLLIPYLIWLAFAVYLNAGVYLLN